MSDTREVAPHATYLVQRFGGALHPNDVSLQDWINGMAADGWRLITVSDGCGYFEKSPTAARQERSTQERQHEPDHTRR